MVTKWALATYWFFHEDRITKLCKKRSSAIENKTQYRERETKIKKLVANEIKQHYKSKKTRSIIDHIRIECRLRIMHGHSQRFQSDKSFKRSAFNRRIRPLSTFSSRFSNDMLAWLVNPLTITLSLVGLLTFVYLLVKFIRQKLSYRYIFR